MINMDITDKLCFFKLEIQETLRMVMDPELHINIVDLGRVYEITIDEPAHMIIVEMTLSSRYCPMGESILSTVKNIIEESFSDYQARVDLVWEPVWSYDNITEEGKKLLAGYDGPDQ